MPTVLVSEAEVVYWKQLEKYCREYMRDEGIVTLPERGIRSTLLSLSRLRKQVAEDAVSPRSRASTRTTRRAPRPR